MKRYLVWAGIAAAGYAAWHYWQARKLGVPLDWAFKDGHLFLNSTGMAAAWAYQYGTAAPALQGGAAPAVASGTQLSGLRTALRLRPDLTR